MGTSFRFRTVKIILSGIPAYATPVSLMENSGMGGGRWSGLPSDSSGNSAVLQVAAIDGGCSTCMTSLTGLSLIVVVLRVRFFMPS